MTFAICKPFIFIWLFYHDFVFHFYSYFHFYFKTVVSYQPVWNILTSYQQSSILIQYTKCRTLQNATRPLSHSVTEVGRVSRTIFTGLFWNPATDKHQYTSQIAGRILANFIHFSLEFLQNHLDFISECVLLTVDLLTGGSLLYNGRNRCLETYKWLSLHSLWRSMELNECNIVPYLTADRQPMHVMQGSYFVLGFPFYNIWSYFYFWEWDIGDGYGLRCSAWTTMKSW